MESSGRIVICARAGCRRFFVLCGRCDRGNRYCEEPCRKEAKRDRLRSAGARYQKTSYGRRKHARRQRTYCERQPKKVTHRGREEAARSEITMPALEPDFMSKSQASSAEGIQDASPQHSPAPAVPSCCTGCGRVLDTLRTEKWARRSRVFSAEEIWQHLGAQLNARRLC